MPESVEEVQSNVGGVRGQRLLGGAHWGGAAAANGGFGKPVQNSRGCIRSKLRSIGDILMRRATPNELRKSAPRSRIYQGIQRNESILNPISLAKVMAK